MNYGNSKSVVRQILEVQNLQQTINGGTAPIYCNLVEGKHDFTVKVIAPSIKVDNLHIEVANNKLRIYNTFSFVNEKGKLMMLPVNFNAFDLPEEANQEMIEAFEEDHGVYLIQIPKGRFQATNRVSIPIKQRK